MDDQFDTDPLRFAEDAEDSFFDIDLDEEIEAEIAALSAGPRPLRHAASVVSRRLG